MSLHVVESSWELLHPFAHRCQHGRNNIQHWGLLRSFVGSLREYEKALLVGSGILGFGIRNTAQAIRKPTYDWNPESKLH